MCSQGRNGATAPAGAKCDRGPLGDAVMSDAAREVLEAGGADPTGLQHGCALGAEIVRLNSRLFLRLPRTIGEGEHEIKVVIGRDAVMAMRGAAEAAVDDRVLPIGTGETGD